MTETYRASGLRILILAACLPAAAFAEGPVARSIDRPLPEFCSTLLRELTPTEKFHVQNAAIEKNGFNVSRGKSAYLEDLSGENGIGLAHKLDHLPKDAVYVDMGAGIAMAITQILRSHPSIAEGVAIAYAKPANFQIFSHRKLTYIAGDFVENLAASGRLGHLKGRVDLITDVYGPLSYSNDVSRLLQVYLDLLKPEGTLLFNWMTLQNSVNEATGAISKSVMNRLNGIVPRGKDPTGLLDWLKKVPGIEVEFVKASRAGSAKNAEESVAIQITKKSADPKIPRELSASEYAEGNPPKRVFRVAP